MEEDKYLWEEYIRAKYQDQYPVDIDLAIEYEKAKQDFRVLSGCLTRS